jgi:signal transduction histidine kinase
MADVKKPGPMGLLRQTIAMADIEPPADTVFRYKLVFAATFFTGAAMTWPISLLAPPTDALGEAGWMVFATLAVIAVLFGIIFSLPRTPLNIPLLTGLTCLSAIMVGTEIWLCGEPSSPYALYWIYVSISASVLPLRLAMKTALFCAIPIAAPLVYLPLDRSTTVPVIAQLVIFLVATAAWLMLTSLGRMGAREQARLTLDARSEAERLRDLDELRERSIASVSHELRSPLTVIKGYVEGMLAGEDGDLAAGQRETAEIVERNVNRLERLVEDLLLLSRIDSNQLELRRSTLDVSELVAGAAADVAGAAERNGLALELALSGGYFVDGDRERLEQVFVNLLSNAVKYGGDGPSVDVRMFRDGARAVTEVCDHGVGIPREELARIGERFFRASTADVAQGHGLGLAITRELIELHGGELQVDSEVGRGSTFRVLLPIV